MNNGFEQPQQYPQSQSQFGQQQYQYGQPQQQFQQENSGQPYPPVPPYAQAQPDSGNWILRWLMYRAAIRIVMLVIVLMVIFGGCALCAFLSFVAH